jgi:polysaccharide chain length determinant protein (PEP-CTERM system associated)
MLPGQTYSPEAIVRILARRAWLIVIALVLGTVVALTVSKRLPDRYRSETLIMLVPQRISDAYVKAAVTARIEDRLNTLEDQILSRSRLERIILDLNLYQALRPRLPMEDVVQRMREEITIKIEGKESFRVSYVSGEARTAQITTARLASLFIEENLRDRENVAEDTNQFLDSQLEDAKRRLVEHEKKLEEYRSRYGGEMPSQAGANLQAIQNSQVQLQVLAEAADRARERRLLLERQISDLQAEPAPVVATPQVTASTDILPGESTEQQLQLARARLQVLLSHDKPDHPDVRMMQHTIRDLEQKQEAESRRQPAEVTTPEKPVTPAERLQQARLRDLRLQMDDIDRQLADKQSQELKLRAVVSEYQARLDAVPKRESDLVELTRDYTTLQTSYQNLLEKREAAKLASNLERRNIGEQFKILDPARVPERPFSPNRVLIDLGGAVGGLALGAFLVGFMEYSDSSFKSEEDVIRLLNLPVLAVVPSMISDLDRRMRRRRTVVAGIAALLLVGAVASLVVWRLQLLRF